MSLEPSLVKMAYDTFFGIYAVFRLFHGKPLEQGRNLGSSLFEAFVPRPLRECFERFTRDFFHFCFGIGF